jgi:hypothetical protein
MGKPIPMKESESSRITIARAMWGRDYAYQQTLKYRNLDFLDFLRSGNKTIEGIV